MAEELVSKYQNLKINDAESNVVDVGAVEDSETNEQLALLLVGRVITDRSFNIDAFKRTMAQVWAVSKRLVIRLIGPNLFLFQFFHWRDKEKVMEGRPWCFDNQLLVLNEVVGTEKPSEVILTHSPFWIRIKDLPFNCRSTAICKTIASNLGYVVEIEDDTINLDNYRRVRIMMDVTKPLCRFQNIKGCDGRVTKVTFAYERLPFFCFLCGMIGHGEKECSNVDDEDDERSMGWGKYLRATPRKGTQRRLEEIEEVKASRRVLFVTKPVKSPSMLSEGEAVVGSGESQVEGGGAATLSHLSGEGSRPNNGEGDKREASTLLLSGLHGEHQVTGDKEVGALAILHGTHSHDERGGQLTNKCDERSVTSSELDNSTVKPLGKYGGGKKWRKLAREPVDVMEGMDFDVVEQVEGTKRSREGGGSGIELEVDVDGKRPRVDFDDAGWREAWSASLQTRRAS